MGFKVTVTEITSTTNLTTVATDLDTAHGTPTELCSSIVKPEGVGSVYPFLLVVVSRT